METQTTQPVATPETKEKKAPTFNKDELLAIFDRITFEGEYSEQVKLKGKLTVTFKTRSAGDTLEISKTVDAIQANLVITVSEQRAILNLAYSMIEYSGKDLSKASIDDRLTFVKKLPVPIIAALSDALATFDLKIDAACKEGDENF